MHASPYDKLWKYLIPTGTQDIDVEKKLSGVLFKIDVVINSIRAEVCHWHVTKK